MMQYFAIPRRLRIDLNSSGAMMAKKENDRDGSNPPENSESQLDPGIALRHVLSGHTGRIRRLAWSPDGNVLISPSADQTIRLWTPGNDATNSSIVKTTGSAVTAIVDRSGKILAESGGKSINLWNIESGKLLHTLDSDADNISSIAFGDSGVLVSGGSDGAIRLWDAQKGTAIRTVDTDINSKGRPNNIAALSIDPAGDVIAAASVNNIKLWKLSNGRRLRTLDGHSDVVHCLAIDEKTRVLASASSDRTVKLWNISTGKLLRTLEGHTGPVRAVSFGCDGQLLCTRSWDHTIRLWNTHTWEIVAVINQVSLSGHTSVPFHPSLPYLAVAGADSKARSADTETQIYIYELDVTKLLKHSHVVRAVHHTTAKVVLVGDHSVGKSGLGYRLVHGEFKEQASTHGQQFWVYPELGKHRQDGTECEAILWDLAGQPDYRLIHALFLDDADLALILFDASDIRDPLHGVAFWLKQLQVGKSRCPTLLVAAQIDRGTSTLTDKEIQQFCRENNISGYVRTSAITGQGLEELVSQMKTQILWDEKPATVTTTTFKKIKDYILSLKETSVDRRAVVSPKSLRTRLEKLDPEWKFTDEEMLTAVSHLENYGYVKRLRTSQGETRILLAPELLNNLASSFVLEARRNPRGLGSLEEARLLDGEYPFPELDQLSASERTVLLDSAAVLFLEHNICFRETDPLNGQSYLVFPELINLKKPAVESGPSIEDGAAYTVSGAVENVYASLVVLLGYTNTFTRTNQWQNHTRYEVGQKLICGFRQDAERDGELDFVLYFGTEVGEPVRDLFRSLFESFLARRNLTVIRYDPVQCSNGHRLNRAVVRDYVRTGKDSTFCNECGAKILLPKTGEAIQLTQSHQAQVDEQRKTAEHRTRFEQAVFRLQTFVKEQAMSVPECFISYAWGTPEHERWVERSLATDLQKAGLIVVLDRWENARIGSSVPRFVERVGKADRVLVVGTQLYRKKYDNGDPMRGFVVAAEGDLIGKRMLGTESEKESVLPLLLEGTEEEAFPILLRGRVYADFRNSDQYFITVFDLILSLYKISYTDQAVADLRELVQGKSD